MSLNLITLQQAFRISSGNVIILTVVSQSASPTGWCSKYKSHRRVLTDAVYTCACRASCRASTNCTDTEISATLHVPARLCTMQSAAGLATRPGLTCKSAQLTALLTLFMKHRLHERSFIAYMAKIPIIEYIIIKVI